MIKYIQMAYGYCVTISFVYLLIKLLSLFLSINAVFYILIIVLFLIFFRVHPNQDSPKYPFAFDLQLLFRHQN